jgi:cytochrome c oxidase subunit IV
MAEHAVQAHGAHEEESHDFVIHEVGIHHPHSSKAQIWRVFIILLCITVLEFLIALTPGIRQTISHPNGALPNEAVVAIFLGLTVLKAFYIVGYFMHLKMEKVNMVYTILLPIMFIVYLIALIMIEGNGGTVAHHPY